MKKGKKTCTPSFNTDGEYIFGKCTVQKVNDYICTCKIVKYESTSFISTKKIRKSRNAKIL